MADTPVNTDIHEQTLEFEQCTMAALEDAKTRLDKQAAELAECEKLIPEVVDALIQHERIDPQQREKAAEILRDPVKVLRTLLKTADPNETIRPRPLGKTASDNGQQKKGHARNPNYVGQKSSRESDADSNFMHAMIGKR